MAVDKKLHIACGFVICLLVGAFLGYIIGFISSVVAGALKELYDYFNQDRHSVEFIDFLATCVGGFLGSVLIYFVC